MLLGIEFTQKSASQVQQALTSASAKEHNIILCKQVYASLESAVIKKIKSNLVLVTKDKGNEKFAPEAYKLIMPFNIHTFKKTLLRITENKKCKSFDEQCPSLVGNSPQIQQVKDIILKVADCDSSILIFGETGTGKDVVANAIHSLSKRSNHPFVPMNCGAIPNELIESELFGHEKGAFTGAYTKKIGRFEYANKGSIFLDEIGDMPLSLQVKLLRIIQDKSFERVGSHEIIETDTRIIAATNKNLEDEVMAGNFREDLFYRLNVISVILPKLSERPEDIPLLIEFFLEKILKRIGHSVTFSKDAMALIMRYTWPGNIRELANFLERIVILYQDEIITAETVIESYPRISKENHIEEIISRDVVASLAF